MYCEYAHLLEIRGSGGHGSGGQACKNCIAIELLHVAPGFWQYGKSRLEEDGIIRRPRSREFCSYASLTPSLVPLLPLIPSSCWELAAKRALNEALNRTQTTLCFICAAQCRR